MNETWKETFEENCWNKEAVTLGFLGDSVESGDDRDPSISRIFGEPVWLNGEAPDPELLKCDGCNESMGFVMQLFTPISNFTHAQNRILYWYICSNPNCQFAPWKVLREQSIEVIPKKEKQEAGKSSFENWDSFENDLDDIETLLQQRDSLPKGKEPRKKKNTKTNNPTTTSTTTTSYYVEIDYEPVKTELPSEARAIDLASNIVIGEDLEDYERVEQSGKVFQSFLDRVSRSPTQILRYSLGGKPLWVSDKCPYSTKDVKKALVCESCGFKLGFEMEVLSTVIQIGSAVNESFRDSVQKKQDWGVAALYTCTESCNSGQAFTSEMVFVQDTL